jgi:hippurate hydrolase
VENLAYPVRIVFQPSEEVAGGAKGMIDQGVLKDAAVIFGGHFDRHYKAGSIVVSSGPVNASTDEFSVKIKGQGGHGARPHESVDAVVVGSLMVMSIQTLVSREVDPSFPSVVSVGQFQAGSAPNVIAGHALLRGTIRAQHDKVRKHLVAGIKRVVESIAEMHGAEIEVRIEKGSPMLENSAPMAELARRAAKKTVNHEQVTELRTANMGGEDFAFYLEKIKGCYVRFGAQVSGCESYPAHSSRFDIDEAALPIAAHFFKNVVLEAQLNMDSLK